jgi:biopolymer transport protein ExbD
MAEIAENSGVDNRPKHKRRAKKLSTHIDMTPMVDLMSLLITFFMLTTAFSKSRIMEIVLPIDGGDNNPSTSIEYPASRTINLILSDNNKIYYYVGKPPMNDNDVKAFAGRLQQTNYNSTGLRKLLLKRNLNLYEKVDLLSKDYIARKTDISQDSLLQLIHASKKKDTLGPIVMIKASNGAKYGNIVDVIDEMEICNIARYAIVDPSEYEMKLLQNQAL